jgi:hypothetical protein
MSGRTHWRACGRGWAGGVAFGADSAQCVRRTSEAADGHRKENVLKSPLVASGDRHVDPGNHESHVILWRRVRVARTHLASTDEREKWCREAREGSLKQLSNNYRLRHVVCEAARSNKAAKTKTKMATVLPLFRPKHK